MRLMRVGGCIGQLPGQVSFILLTVRGSMKLELVNNQTGFNIEALPTPHLFMLLVFSRNPKVKSVGMPYKLYISGVFR